MTDLLSAIYRSGTVTDREGRSLALHSHLPKLESQILADWLRAERPTRLLEIGLAYGVSALVIGATIREWDTDCYHVIDPHQHSEWNGVGLANLARLGVADRVTFHETPSEFCLPTLAAAGERLDFAFVDGWHSFDQVSMELYYIDRMLVPGGIVVFDDVHLPSIKLVCAHLRARGCYEALPLPQCEGRSTQLNVRRMMKLPPARIAAFRKTGDDHRGPNWVPEG